jgi:hemolysin activation/secretion protein
MRYCVLILLFFISLPLLPLSAQNEPTVQATVRDKGVLIRHIDIEGFVLGDKNQFVKLFKPYRNKYLTSADMDAVLQKIQIIYEREGYQQLVSITYHVDRHRLVFTALMTS